jgi:hypothetical protein
MLAVAATDSGTLETSTATNIDTLTPPSRSVSPTTADSGIPSRTTPNTMAVPEATGATPAMFLRSW